MARARDCPESPDGLAIPPVRAAGLLLVDGLGARLLQRYAADAPFLSSLPDAGPLTAGFPSSTVDEPDVARARGRRRGTTGWSGSRCGSGPGGAPGCCTRCTGPPSAQKPPVDLRDDFPPEGVQPGPTALERAAAAGVGVTVVSARRFENSGLTRAALRGGTLPRRDGARRPRRRDDHRARRAGPAALLRLPRRPRRAGPRARPGVAAVAAAARRRSTGWPHSSPSTCRRTRCWP